MNRLDQSDRSRQLSLSMAVVASLALSIATMVTGVLGAASRFDMKRILSFHIISQIGYMTLGLALFTPLAIAATLFVFRPKGTVPKFGGWLAVYGRATGESSFAKK